MIKKTQNFIFLIYRSLIFDPKIYKIAKNNSEYTKLCLLVVFTAALANGVSTAYFTNNTGLFKQLIFSIIGWMVRSGVIYVIGVKILGYKSNILQVIRTQGISYAPQILNLLAIIPLIGINIFILSITWLFFTTVFAVGLTFNCSRLTSFFITVAGLIPYVFIMFFIIQ